MKRPQTKFHADNICDSKVIRSKKVNIYHRLKFIVRPNFLGAHFFSIDRYFIQATVTDIDMLLHL